MERASGTLRALPGAVLLVRSPLLLLVAALASSVAMRDASAIEIAADGSGGVEFLYLTTDVRQTLGDELAVSLGYAAVSDWSAVRHGARVAVDGTLEPLTLRLAVEAAPRQAERGWLGLALTTTLAREAERFTVEAEATLRLRRVDTRIGRAIVPIDQIQLDGEGRMTIAERLELGLRLVASIYDVALPAEPAASPSTERSSRSDVGLLVTIGGRPERWAIAGHAALRVQRRWRGEVGVAGVAFVDGSGGALVPRVAVASGPWGWLTVAASLECALDAPRSSGPRWIAGGSLEIAAP